MYIILYYIIDITDVSEGIDVNKTNASKECDICHYFFMILMNLRDISILKMKGSDCRCILSLISKNEVIKVINSTC